MGEEKQQYNKLIVRKKRETLTYDELLEKRKEKFGLDERTVELMLEFDKFNVTRKISLRRRIHYLYYLPPLAKLLKPVNFENATKKDYENLIYKLEQQKNYGDRVKSDFKIALKCFVKFVKGKGDEDTMPPEVAWIKAKKKYKIKPPEELLTEDEIKRLIRASKDPRDRAMISTAWEGGFRTAELIGIRVKDLTFTDDGVRVSVDGKTGRRNVLLISSAPLVASYLEYHPLKDDPEAPLWVVKRDRGTMALSQVAAMDVLHNIFKRAKVKKKAHFYLFRHTRASQLALKLKDYQLRQYFGWTMESNMPSVYISLSGRDLDNTIREMHGLKESETFKEKLSVRVCERCQLKNSPERTRCERCTAPLDLQTALEQAKNQRDLIIQGVLAELGERPERAKIVEHQFQNMKAKV